MAVLAEHVSELADLLVWLFLYQCSGHEFCLPLIRLFIPPSFADAEINLV